MKFSATSRSVQGSSASRRLRHAGRVPAIVYGGEATPQNIELDHNDIYHALRKEQFHSSILDLEIDGKGQQVLLRSVQWHAYKQQVLHVDFQRVAANQALTTKVPLHFINEENSPAVKVDKCLISHVVADITVQCLASQLPEFITVDLSALQKGGSFTLKQVKLPKGVVAHVRGTQSNPALVSIVPPADELVAPVEGAAAPAAPAKKGKK